MRYRELTERMAPHEYDGEEITEVLIRDCAPYLNEINGQVQKHILWRGLQGTTAKGFGKKYSRIHGRFPLNTKMSQQATINKFFVDNFEHPFRNGVFVSGDLMQAMEYSQGGSYPHAIFPIGNFEYLWHPRLDDMYNTIANVAPAYTEKLMNDLKRGYRQDGLIEAIHHSGGLEIMIWCEEYYYMEKNMLGQIGKFIQ